MTIEAKARHGVAGEVLELGQTLFDTLIEAASAQRVDGDAVEPFAVDEVRAAADEFFVTLRLLLGLEEAP